MDYPSLPYSARKYQREVLAIGGLNLSDNTQDGDLADCRNLSSHRFPYFTTRNKRSKLTAYSGATALTAWEKLVVVQGTNLLYDGNVVGQVTAGAKQFAVVNTKLIIWPDKKYLDIDTLTVKPLGASVTGNGAVFTESEMTVTGWTDLTTLFKAGDTVTISGCVVEAGNNKSVYIKAVEAGKLTVTANAFTAATETAALTVTRKIPDLDFICESENRLWGCSNADKTIYASALGDPTNFYTYEGISTDSYAVAVGSEGDFTGCVRLSTSILFFKENMLHKMLGSYPAEYALYDYNVEGIQKGCEKSAQVINEVLFYKGLHGIYTYSGGIPSLLTARLGNHDLTDAVGGTDGDRYYLSCKDGTRTRLLVYDIQDGILLEEDDTAAVDFARIGKDMYFLDSAGNIYLADAGEPESGIAWTAQLTPFYETMSGRKRYTKLLLRAELPAGSWIKVELRSNEGAWIEAAKFVGVGLDTETLPIKIGRCDHMSIRLSGVGPCTIYGIVREFTVGSDV